MSQKSEWKSQIADDMRFKTTDYVVDDADYHGLWERWSHRYGLPFEQDSMGHCATIGMIDGRPIAVTVFWYIVGGFRVAIVEGSSQLVDHKMIEDWEQVVFPCLKKGYRHSNGSNFHNLVHDMNRRLEEAGKPKMRMRDPRKVDEAVESVPVRA